jgi:nitrogen fixation/metabolism regulation signal transduction histidine kinase
MYWRVRKPVKVFARAASLRRRVAYSLAIVRLILVPVIFLAIYYLFAMGSIVDRIVSVDAQVASLAENGSIDMMDARRAERNYFLLHDPEAVQATRQSLEHLQQTLNECRSLMPEERSTIANMEAQARLYRQRFEEAVARMGQPTEAPSARMREVVKAYERDLNNLLSHNHRTRAKLIEELQSRVGSLDAQVAATLTAQDPAFGRITVDLDASSAMVMRLASELKKRSWDRVQRDRAQTHRLVRRAEWVLVIVSSLTVLLSVWVSFILPREVVRPLAQLKAAVDHAAAGNYEIEFDVQGEGEVVQLADSVRNLIAHVREKRAAPG